jgi:hypothetical protein
MTGQFGVLSADRLPRSNDDIQPTEIEARADRAAPGEWDENLKKWGVTDWRLPGQGEPGPRCGEWYAESVCESCGYLGAGTHVCGRRSCPDCWGVWANESGVRAAHRVQSYRYTQPDDWHRQVAHAVVSAPEGEVMNERQFWEGRSKAAEIAEEKGFRGCAVIPHPYRVTDEGQEEYERADPDYGIWVWLRNEVEDMDRYIYWSPHYHIVGPTGADMDPAEDSDEWVYHFMRSVEPFEGVRDADSHEDLYGLFRYLLSHTGFPAESTKQATTWYGDLANSVFVEDATEEWQHEKPSEGVRSALKREIEAVAGPTDDEDGDGAERETDDEGDCPEEGCDGVLINVFDVNAYLRQANPPDEIQERMRAARDWRLGRIEPPPGLKRPRTEEQAREAWDAIVSEGRS